MPEPFLELIDISKTYPGVVALDHVSFAVAPGEVIGLVGENGAGKSTLMRVLGGVVEPSAGTIRIDGIERRRSTSRKRSRPASPSSIRSSTCSTISTSPPTSSSAASRAMAGR